MTDTLYERLREHLRWRWLLFKVDDHWWNRSTRSVTRWNGDKPHRCPACHTIVVQGGPARSWVVYTCCSCACRFARWPIFTSLLTRRTCPEIPSGTCPHQGAPT